ncbi:aldo-keto reductase AKR2E4-like [Pieris napi]|uniref:aldo-keto reductase AKR2E4-like n=1 Tax=Pieris napi TaxID=78633 RepID=UPI001FBC0066|nr:aldo-keto reductase AKR2E4-like [Pieris napi]
MWNLSLILFCAALVHSKQFPIYKLNDANEVPGIGLGTFILKTPYESVYNAIKAGYRYIDTALFFRNEAEVGRAISDAINQGIVTRKELFITGKLWNTYHERDRVELGLRRSLQNLSLSYFDLYEMHTPMAETEDGVFTCTDYVDTWKGMEDLQKKKLVKSIGVANFNSKQINRILANCDVVPAVNEIEVNPSFPNLPLVSYCQQHGIKVIAFSPMGYIVLRQPGGNSKKPYPDDPYLTKLAQKYKKNVYQIVLRYSVDRGFIPIPRSDNPDHMKENLDIFDFKLTQKEVQKINEFDINSRVFDFGQFNNHLHFSFNHP